MRNYDVRLLGVVSMHIPVQAADEAAAERLVARHMRRELRRQIGHNVDLLAVCVDAVANGQGDGQQATPAA